jgi:hypothetical protein
VPALDWNSFETLAGAATRNFELLCRGAIRRNYGSKGDFQSVAQQPGVEFHLRLAEKSDELGEPPRWWGWQCRWYGIPAGSQIGQKRREDVVKAIRTTEKWLPDLTDWVLWTRRPLTPTDQTWFRDLETTLTLHLRTGEDDLPDLLIGEAAPLRAAYFGELVLTPGQLAKMRAEGIEAVRRRYNADVHVKVRAEKVLEQVLGKPESWSSLSKRATALRRMGAQLQADRKGLADNDPTRATVTGLLRDADAVEARLRSVLVAMTESGPEQAAALADAPMPRLVTRREVERAMGTLRVQREPAGLGMHMVDAELRRTRKLLTGFARRVGVHMCAIVGDAGCGKSNLTIDLTASSENCPAGIYLQGRNLPKNGSLEDLLRPLISRPNGTFRDLLEALDAAGGRASRRVPLVIDGLNEAEDPTRFKPLLSALKIASQDFPNVLVVLTLRESAYDYAMPDSSVPSLELFGFDTELDKAISVYFERYKIDRGDVRLPLRLFRQPLLLWMFCEIANPDHGEGHATLPLSRLPATAIALYERFRDESVRRIATELLNCAEQDVAEGLDRVALELWDRGLRALPFSEVRNLIDRDSEWSKSIARALEDEGVLMRESAPSYPEQPSGILFDAFAGFLIADAIVRNVGLAGIDGWLKDEDNLIKLDRAPERGHPLASDILTALAGLLPLRAHRQLWPYLNDGLREQALIDAADLESGRIDPETSDALARLLSSGSHRAFGRIMARVQEVRADPHHRLNADFLDRVLRGLTVADRDLRWSEWVRTTNAPGWPQRTGVIQRDVQAAERAWRESGVREDADRLLAVWISWLLTTTDRSVRDHATEALYRFGRGDPRSLFDMTTSHLDLDDPYVSERMLAACYGVIMANQRPVDPGFEGAYHRYLSALGTAMCGPAATHPTSHILARSYAMGTSMMAKILYPAIADGVKDDWSDSFASTPAPRGIRETSKRGAEVQRALRMDFENYTVGGLYRDRSNYDRAHVGYRKGLAQVRGRIWQLGWRENRFQEVDDRLGEEQWRSGREDRPDRVDRYGKKYGWIAYYELAGRLQDSENLPSDITEHIVDVDPSFPHEPAPLPIAVPRWARSTPARISDWVRKGVILIPDELLVPPTLDGHAGPWVAVYAWLRDYNNLAGRRVWGSLEALLLPKNQVLTLLSAMTTTRWSDTRWPEAPSDYYTMAGEIPWSPRFAGSLFREDPTPYADEVALPNGGIITPETVAHRYAWEDYHSSTNRLGGLAVPSRLLSQALGLVRAPDSLDHVDRDGQSASRIYLGPPDFESGNILYIRRDLLEAYARRRRREVVLVTRGERQPDYDLMRRRPRWLVNTAQSRIDEWIVVRRLQEFA